jgi:hypothetical protein
VVNETPVVPEAPVPDLSGTELSGKELTGNTVELIHSEPQSAVEFAGDNLAELFEAAADWVRRFEAWRGAAVDVLAATTEMSEDGGPAYRLILMCPESQFEETGNGPAPLHR